MSKQAAKEGEKRPLPGSYSEMYPSRFVKSDMLKGAKVTLTIKDIFGEGLKSEEKKPANLEWIVSFVERPLEFVINYTNATCLYRMFGGDPRSWIGRKITLFPTTTMAFGESVECIRIWGSPEIEEDLKITVRQGRRSIEMTMHKVSPKPKADAPAAPKPSREHLDPRIQAGLKLMKDEAADQWLIANAALPPKEMLAALNAQLDADAA